jgi:hypothetical protein
MHGNKPWIELPANAARRSKDYTKSGYSNIETYLNSVVDIKNVTPAKKIKHGKQKYFFTGCLLTAFINC